MDVDFSINTLLWQSTKKKMDLLHRLSVKNCIFAAMMGDGGWMMEDG